MENGLQVLIVGHATHAMTSRLATALRARGHDVLVLHPDALVAEVGVVGGVDVRALSGSARLRPEVAVCTVSSDHVPAALACERLAHFGTAVLNPASAGLLAADKFRSALVLADAGLSVPRAVLVGTPEAAELAAGRLGLPVVLKTSDGAEGAQVRLCESPDTVHEVFAAVRQSADQPVEARTPLIVQEFLNYSVGRDRRFFVVDGVVQAAMDRVARAGEWRSNLSLGGAPVAVEPTPEEIRTAGRAAAALGLDFACIDLMATPHGPVVVEANPFGDMLDVAMVTGLDLIGSLVDLVERRGGRPATGPVTARPLADDDLTELTAFCVARMRRKAVQLGLALS